MNRNLPGCRHAPPRRLAEQLHRHTQACTYHVLQKHLEPELGRRLGNGSPWRPRPLPGLWPVACDKDWQQEGPNQAFQEEGNALNPCRALGRPWRQGDEPEEPETALHSVIRVMLSRPQWWEATWPESAASGALKPHLGARATVVGKAQTPRVGAAPCTRDGTSALSPERRARALGQRRPPQGPEGSSAFRAGERRFGDWGQRGLPLVCLALPLPFSL